MCVRKLAGAIAMMVLASRAPLAAQSMTAEEALAAAQGRTGAESVSTACKPSYGGEIVVCVDRGRDQRVFGPSNSTDSGVPDAPNLAPGGAGGVTVRGCFLQKCPKPVYYVDVTALPKAAEGTDADRIAKGEMRGN
jgi:hypothetical protein